jgi:hypothetical protein
VTTDVQFEMRPRNQSIADALEDYAEGRISYATLYLTIQNMGYSTRSLFEMVRDITPKARVEG